MRYLALFLALSLGTAGFIRADVIVGSPADPTSNGNCFPFGCRGTIYQQVYAASNFSEQISIHGLGFFDTQSQSNAHVLAATYTISLSTTSKAVNGLDTVTFDNNLGADNTVFFSGLLGGAVGSEFDIIGSSNFNYNPANGNLLLDIRVSDRTEIGNAILFLDARSGTAAGLFSRAHDFGSGFTDFGLVTKFSTSAVSAVPEPSAVLLLGSVVALYGLREALRRRNR